MDFSWYFQEGRTYVCIYIYMSLVKIPGKARKYFEWYIRMVNVYMERECLMDINEFYEWVYEKEREKEIWEKRREKYDSGKRVKVKLKI